MGFGTSVTSMMSSATTTATNLFSDFWPVVAFFVGLVALGFIVNLFIRNRG